MLSGDAIRMVRRRRNMSQTEFGTMVGVSKTTVTDWEMGKSRISEDNERRLEELFGEELRLPISVGPQSSKSSIALSELVRRLASVNPDLMLEWNDLLKRWDKIKESDLRFLSNMFLLSISQIVDNTPED